MAGEKTPQVSAGFDAYPRPEDWRLDEDMALRRLSDYDLGKIS